jgi:hypothetical protein
MFRPLSHQNRLRHYFYAFLVTIVLLIFCSSSYIKKNWVIFILLIRLGLGMNLDLMWALGDLVGGDVNEAGSMLVFMSRDDINLDLSLAPPMVDKQAAPLVVEI